MVQDLLAELRSRGVRLRLDGDHIEVVASRGSLTPRLRSELTERREELIALLRRVGPARPEAAITPDPEARHEPFTLTDIQHAYWVGRGPAIELGGVSTYLYLELESSGLDARRLSESLRKVIDRHGMLRAVIGPDGQQRVLPSVPTYQIPVIDLREQEADGQIGRIRTEMEQQVLPADRWPLFDIRASRFSDGRLRLHIGLDMLIMDGLSFNIFFSEWRRFYESPDWAPEPLVLSYRDYVLAREASRSGAEYLRAREYWTGRLHEISPAPELPLAVQPERVGRPVFARRHARLDGDRWDAIKKSARQRGLTPSAILMTAYTDVLSRWTGNRDFTLNLTLFDRPAMHPQIDRLIGDFTAVLLLSVRASGDVPFAVRAARLQQQLLNDLEHQSYNGVRVLRDRARTLGGNPRAAVPVIFTSLFGVASADTPDGDVGFFGRVTRSVSQTPQVWIDHQAMEDRRELILNWDVVDALFPAGMIDDMFACYQDLLHGLSEEDCRWDAARMPLPLPRWQAGERDRANASGGELPEGTLCQLVEATARSQPDAVAVTGDDGTLRYGELIARARRLAGSLTGHGVRPGSLVGVVTDKGCDQVAAVLGVVRSGAAYLPIDPGWPQARRWSLLERCQASVVVTSPRLRDALAWPPGTTVLTVADADATDAADEPLDAGPRPGDLAYVIFTSGSTGTPKGVMIDHRSAVNTITDINARFGIGPRDRVLALSALSFDLSVYDIFGALAAGAAIVMPCPAREHDPAHWDELVRQHAVTVWNSVPALLQMWVDERRRLGPHQPAGLRIAMLSGDWIPVSLPGAIRALDPDVRVFSLGGATEASIWSVCYPIGEVPSEWTRIPYGKPLSGQTLHVYDETLNPCPVWVTGEIYIGGAGVALGYWADADRTAERFIVHPGTDERLYRTGDYGRYLPGGDIDFLGRRDFQVKINGFRVELGEIAEVLRRQPGVADVVVTAPVSPATGRRQLSAYLVPAPAQPQPEPARLRERLAELLPEYMVPHHYRLIDKVPVSPNGKVDPAVLPSPWYAERASEGIPPRDELERALHEIWCASLERADIGIQDNFFELGGDSLHAVRILSRVRDELGVDNGDEGLGVLFDHPTVEMLAAALRDQVEPARWPR
jgi:amino acid adenylation domain-containing protein